MRELSDDYVSGSKAAVRDVLVKIKLNDEESTVYEMDELMPISINRKITDGSLSIGNVSSDRIYFSAATTEKIPKKTRITLYNSFGGTYERLGRFYCETSPRSGKMINVTAFDAMDIIRNRTVKFTSVSSKDLSALTFPCQMQDMLDYIVTMNGLTCEFECQPFTVQEKPMKNETEYYTVGELLSFIGSAHARNVRFDYSGKLSFVGFTSVSTSLTASNVIDMTIDDSEPFTVTGVLFKVGDDTIYIDDVSGSEYDDTAEGVIKVENPLASVEIAEYVWSQLGGLSYYGGTLKLRGAGILECGDVITVKNLKNPDDTAEYQMCITGINYTIGDDGFIETVTSEVSKSSGTSLSSSSNSSSGIEYYAGQGITISEDNVIKVKTANNSDIGGVNVTWTETADFNTDDPEESYSTDQYYGIYRRFYPGYIALRTATSYQKGGFFLGDGFVPVLKESESSSGETVYTPGERVELRLGDGLYFVEKDENESDAKEKRRNYLGGRAVGVQKATAEQFGIVKVGKKLSIDADGSLYAVMKGGDGIDVSDYGEISVKVDEKTIAIDGNGYLMLAAGAGGSSYEEGDGILIETGEEKAKISVNIDNDTITLNESGQLVASGLTIESAVIIQEADAKYLLHEYTEVEYVAGNKIVYGDQQSCIIAQGYKHESASSPVYTGVESFGEMFPEGMPAYYTAISLEFGGVTYILEYYVKSINSDGGRVWELRSSKDGGTTWSYHGTTSAFYGASGMYYRWSTIYPPSDNYPYGYALADLWYFGIISNGYTTHTKITAISGVTSSAAIAFASEAEYNAAVSLTYEPVSLTETQETVTEV